MTQRNLLFNVLCLLAGVLITWIICYYNPDKPDLPPDTSKWDNRFDSLLQEYDKRGDTINIVKAQKDSLNKALKNNHKNVANGKAEIDSFTPDSRARWHDSVMQRAGFRKIVPNVP